MEMSVCVCVPSGMQTMMNIPVFTPPAESLRCCSHFEFYFISVFLV